MKRALCIVLGLSLLAAPGRAGESKEMPLGFWEIPPTAFSADIPVAMRSPIPDDPVKVYYWWAFSFVYTPSTQLLLDHYASELERMTDRESREQIQKQMDIIKQRAGLDEPRVRMHVSMHTDTGKSSYNLSLPCIRDIAQAKLGVTLETVDEIRARQLKAGETVRGVAIFPEIDPFSDAFEIRVLGLGKRFRPRYDPGALYMPGTQYEAHLRKAMRFFYERPGDDTAREQDSIYFNRRSAEWIWMWYMDLYPTAPARFVTVQRSEGLSFDYVWFPYALLNSTSTPQTIEMLEAGLSPRVAWHNLSITLDMTDRHDTDFWKIQAMRQIRAEMPGILPEEGTPYKAVGTVEPGTEKMLKGVAVMRWGVASPAELLKSLVKQMHARAFSPTEADRTDPLFKAYMAMRAPEEKDTRIWERPELPADAVVQDLILKQAADELAAAGISMTPADEKRYGALASFTLLMNHLARQNLDHLQDEKNAILPVRFVALWNGIADEVQVMRRYNIDLTQLKRDIVDPNIITGGSSFTPLTTTPAAADTGGAADTGTKSDGTKPDGGKTEGGTDWGSW